MTEYATRAKRNDGNSRLGAADRVPERYLDGWSRLQGQDRQQSPSFNGAKRLMALASSSMNGEALPKPLPGRLVIFSMSHAVAGKVGSHGFSEASGCACAWPGSRNHNKRARVRSHARTKRLWLKTEYAAARGIGNISIIRGHKLNKEKAMATYNAAKFQKEPGRALPIVPKENLSAAMAVPGPAPRPKLSALSAATAVPRPGGCPRTRYRQFEKRKAILEIDGALSRDKPSDRPGRVSQLYGQHRG